MELLKNSNVVRYYVYAEKDDQTCVSIEAHRYEIPFKENNPKVEIFDVRYPSKFAVEKKSTFIYSVQISEEKTVLSYNKPVPLPACGSYKPLTSTAVVIEEIAEEITQNSVVENSFDSTTNQTKSESTTPFPGRIREQT